MLEEEEEAVQLEGAHEPPICDLISIIIRRSSL